jgi:hypothetical protein
MIRKQNKTKNPKKEADQKTNKLYGGTFSEKAKEDAIQKLTSFFSFDFPPPGIYFFCFWEDFFL